MDDYNLELIKKQLKMEAQLSNLVYKKYRYYNFLITMFKYGIIFDEIKDIVEKNVNVKIHNTDMLKNIFGTGKNIDINIEISDGYFDSSSEDILIMSVIPFKNKYIGASVFLDCDFDTEIVNLIKGVKECAVVPKYNANLVVKTIKAFAVVEENIDIDYI